MVSAQLEKIFYHFILRDIDLIELTNPKFFENEFIKKCFEYSKEFALKYNEAPSARQVNELAKMHVDFTDEEKKNLKVLFDAKVDEYDDEWVKQNVKGWIEFKNLDLSVIDMLTYLKTTKVTMENVSEIVEKVKSIIYDRNNIDFDFDEGLDFFNPDSHEQPVWDTFKTGFPYLDIVLGGGWMTKGLFVLAGENKIGKCFIGDTKIKIRNKKTGEIKNLSVENFFKLSNHLLSPDKK